MNRFVMNSIGMFSNFKNLYDSFMNCYGYNYKNNLFTSKRNCCGTHQVKFIFMNSIIFL